MKMRPAIRDRPYYDWSVRFHSQGEERFGWDYYSPFQIKISKVSVPVTDTEHVKATDGNLLSWFLKWNEQSNLGGGGEERTRDTRGDGERESERDGFC